MKNKNIKTFVALLALMLFQVSSYAQKAIVVKDESGNPVPGVVVTIGEGSKPITTNEKGEFPLKIDGKTTILLEAKGFEKQYVVALPAVDLPNIVMIKSAFNMSTSDLVKVPFGEFKRGQIPGAVTAINTSELLEHDQAKDFSAAILGKVPGLYGSNDIRGLGAPLIVVDGVPRPGLDYNIQMIDQITVAKDLLTSMLYGGQAKNGVIYITTKRGAPLRKDLDFTFQAGLNDPISYPQFLSSGKYMELYNEALANDGLAPKYTQAAIDGSYSGSDPVQFPDESYYNSTYLRNFSNYYNLVGEASGGNDIAQYYLNVGLNRTTGFLNLGEGKNEKRDRINVRGNVDYKLNDVIKIRFDGAVIFNMTTAPRYTNPGTDFWSLSSSSLLYPNAAPALIPVDLMQDIKLLGAANLVENKYLLGGTSEYQTNMYGELTMNGPEETNERLLEMNVGLNFNLNKLTPGLTADLFFTYDLQNVFRTDIMNTYAVYTPTYTDGAISSWSKNNLDTKVNTLTLADVIFSRRNGLYGKIDYHKTAGYHEITANALGYFDQYTFEGILQPTKHLNFGARVNYAYKQKMIAEITGVVSGSTKLSETTPWGFQPGFGLGWIMTKENFLAGRPNINYLKLRGNIALTKNDGALNNYFPGHDFYTQSSSYPYNHGTGSNYSFLLTRGNPNLGFEKRINANFGFDALLLQDKLTLEASWFYYKTYDAFSLRNNYLPAYFGSLYWQNFGSYDTKGAEIGAAYTYTVGDISIKLGSNLVYSVPKNLVVDELNFKEDYLKAAGKAGDAMFGYVSMGLFQDQADINNSPTQLFGTVNPGDIKYQDLNNDGQIDELDQKMIGNSHPRVDYSFNLSLTYKAFELFVLATGQGGYNTIYNSPYYWVYGNRKYSDVVLNRWSPSGAEKNSLATYPRLSTLSSENNFRNSTYWLYKSNWFTLQTAQLTYTLPSKVAGIKEARFFARGNNLMTMSKTKDKMQLNIGTAPQTRFYSLGISVTL